MSQAQAPILCKDWSGWKDEDFYVLMVILNRISRIHTVLYYLFHPREALRNFRLWLKFRHVLKVPKLERKLNRPKFNWKKQATSKSCVVKDDDKLFDEALKMAEEQLMSASKKVKMRQAYDLALEMQSNGMIANTKEDLDKQVDEMLKFDDSVFAAYKKTIKATIEDKKKIK